MAEMSPLARVLMGILQKGTWVAGGLLALFAGILLWQRYTPEGFVWQAGDKGFFGLLAVLFALAVYLIRSFKKEMDNPGG
jgi:urea transporter